MNTNYENGKIYKIVDNTTDMIYVGSTCKTLQQRLSKHKNKFKGFKLGKASNVTVFKILENEDYKIELIKLHPCNNKQELNLEEGKIIKQFRNEKINIVNKNIAGQTDKEYNAQYRQKNINSVKAKQNQKHSCICGGKFSQCSKSRHLKSNKHQKYINNSKTINIDTLNITININNPEDLNKLDLLNIVK